MEIRGYKPEDYTGVVALIERFHAESVEMYGFDCNRKLVTQAIQKHHNHALILEVCGEVVGLVAGHLIECPLQARRVYQEMIWYVDAEYREHGIKLLRALEKRCKERGITSIIMVAIGSSMKEKLDRVYKAMGYNELETHYIKGLT